MQTPKWLIVARNEYRVKTGRIRKIRPYFPFLMIGILSIYVGFIAPRFVAFFVDDFLTLLLSQVAVAMLQIILFTVFFYFMIIPITDTLREETTGQLEIFLAAPVKPSDVLLGEFLGELPFYTIFLTVFVGFFTALLNPLGMDIIQITIITVVIIIVSLSGLWIGTVVAAILRTKLGATARGKDIGRALAMIIALPMVGLIYAIQFGGLFEILSDPKTSGVVKTILGFLPSSWGGEIIVGFASNPGNISAVFIQTVTRFGGLIFFFLGALWLGAKVANHAYSLEPTTFIAAEAKPDGRFYKSINRLGGGDSFGYILVAIFKDYSRRLENLSNITYMVGLLLLMSIFIVPSTSTETGVPVSLMLTQFIFPVVVVMITGEITVRGKENIFIYKKAPSGVAKLIKAMLLKGWLIAVPIAAIISILTTILSPQATLNHMLLYMGIMVLLVASNVVFVLGLFLLNPAYSAKSARLGLNIMITVFSSIGLFALSLFLQSEGFRPVLLSEQSESFGNIMYVELVQILLSWLWAIVFLYLGKRKLNRTE